MIPGRVPAFEEIEPDVKTAWLGEQKALAWEKAYKEMRAKYTVLLPAPPARVGGRVAVRRRRNARVVGRGVEVTGARRIADLARCCSSLLARTAAARAHEARPRISSSRRRRPASSSVLWRTPVLAGMRLPLVAAAARTACAT